MDGAIRVAPLLLIAVAAGPAAAEPSKPSLTLQSMDSVRSQELPRLHDRALRHRLFKEDEENTPTWTLPLGLQSDERDNRPVTFSVRPGRGLKAVARIRF
jgi:hypothetical protein